MTKSLAARRDIDTAIQNVIDATPPEQFPRTAYGLRNMLLSAGLRVEAIKEGETA